jgi:hypothetical protein
MLQSGSNSRETERETDMSSEMNNIKIQIFLKAIFLYYLF